MIRENLNIEKQASWIKTSDTFFFTADGEDKKDITNKQSKDKDCGNMGVHNVKPTYLERTTSSTKGGTYTTNYVQENWLEIKEGSLMMREARSPEDEMAFPVAPDFELARGRICVNYLLF